MAKWERALVILCRTDPGGGQETKLVKGRAIPGELIYPGDGHGWPGELIRLGPDRLIFTQGRTNTFEAAGTSEGLDREGDDVIVRTEGKVLMMQPATNIDVRQVLVEYRGTEPKVRLTSKLPE